MTFKIIRILFPHIIHFVHQLQLLTSNCSLQLHVSSPKWPVMCRVGRYTLQTHSHSVTCDCVGRWSRCD